MADWPTVRDSTALEEERGKEGGRREQSSEHWQCGGSEGNAAGGSWTDRRPGYHETYWPSRLTTLGVFDVPTTFCADQEDEYLLFSLAYLTLFARHGSISKIEQKHLQTVSQTRHSQQISSRQTVSHVIQSTPQTYVYDHFTTVDEFTCNGLNNNNNNTTVSGVAVNTGCLRRPAEPAITSGSAAVGLTSQQRHRIKSRRRDFKAVYLTLTIVGVFVVLWFPHMLGRVLASARYNPILHCKTFSSGWMASTSTVESTWC